MTQNVTSPPLVPAPPDVAAPETAEQLEGTCIDRLKNQDETDIDCGGVCKDITGTYFYDGDCHMIPKPAPPANTSNATTLSGAITLSVSSVEKLEAASGALKVKSLKLTVENGKAENLFPKLVLFVKDGSIFLNQFGDDLGYDDVPYKIVELDKVAGGKTFTGTVDVSGAYLPGGEPGYAVGDAFDLVIEMYDDSGDKLDSVVKRVS